MSKEVLVISTSLRKDGNSETLANEFVKGVLYVREQSVVSFMTMPTLSRRKCCQLRS